MLTISHSVPWVHVTPAFLAVIVAFLYLKTKKVYLKMLFGILWLILIPNTAYIFIDIERITLHWKLLTTFTRVMVILQYIIIEIIGLATFLLAMLPSEKILHDWNLSKKKQIAIIVLFNFFIGFCMALGRTGYTNSYVVFTQPIKVFFAAVHIITSLELLGLAIFFGILCNFIYFLFRNMLMHYARKFL